MHYKWEIESEKKLLYKFKLYKNIILLLYVK